MITQAFTILNVLQREALYRMGLLSFLRKDIEKAGGGESIYCIYCGRKLPAAAKFCMYCGEQLSQSSGTINNQMNSEHMVKCPNCGSSLGAFDGACPSCGSHIIDKKVPTSVQQFADKIFEIESTRKTPKLRLSLAAARTISDTAAREIALIKSFPIPNSVEEITEFMFLAEANIETRLSKNTLVNRLNKMPEWNYPNDFQFISDAWVSKMHQVYRKAEVSFSNDPMFRKIQEVYDKKMKALR